MNKHIEKLVEEAGFIRFLPEENPATPIDWSCDYTPELEQFAMLVIGDCIRTIQMGVQRGKDSSAEYKQSVKHIKDLMKRYEIGA